MIKIKKPPIERKWAVCTHCGKNAVLYDDTANANGIWHKCKACGREYELRIINGEQVTGKLPSS